MNKRLILIPIIFLCSILFANAQSQLTISGVVLDDMKETLPGVSVYFKDKPGIGTTTNSDGKFTIKANKGDVIIFSSIGFETHEHYVTKAESNLTIEMKVSAITLDEAVVTGMGTTQRKISVVGAVTSINAKELQTPAVSINNMLGGRVPGIISMQSSGEPGKDIAEFWVRGIGTFGANSSALVLIDGLEGNLSEIDPADIESFSVLKDASATAVYGVRGANGVILVTTKRGEEGKLKITGRANFTVSHLTRLPEYVDSYEYAKLANEAMAVRGGVPKYSEMALTLIKNNLDPDLYPNVNWQDEIIKTNTFKQSYYASIRGGGKVARYFVSLGLSDEPAGYKQEKGGAYSTQTGFSKYTFRSNVDIDLTKNTKVFFGSEGFYSKNVQPGISSTNYLWQAQAMLTPIIIPKKYSTGEIPAFGQTNQFSPYVMLNHTGLRSYEQSNMLVTLSVVQDFSSLLKGLTWRAQGAYNNTSYFDESRFALPDMYYASGRRVDGSLQMVKKVSSSQTLYGYRQDQYRKFHFESTLNYSNTFAKDHQTTALVYYYISDQKKISDLSKYSQSLPVSLAALPIRYQGVSSRITYGYKDTYMIDWNFGYTGSENFQPGRQYGFFPSVAVGWIPTQYQFMQDKISWLNFLKLRFSYGSVGNDRITGDKRFPYLTTFSYYNPGWGGSFGISEDNVGADNLMWEKALKSDFGIEAHLFNKRINLVVDFFNDQRDGIFQQRTQVPEYIGANNMPYGNVGRMKSYGSDGNISYTEKINKDLSITVRGNFTYSRNEIQNWEQPDQKYSYQNFNGWPSKAVRGFKSLGLFRDEADVAASPTQFGTVLPGDIKYKDINADGKIDDFDMVPLSLANNFPTLMYGFGGEVSYKKFTLGFLFKGIGNTDYYSIGMYDSDLGSNTGVGYIPFVGEATGNVLSMVANQKNRWTPASYSGNPNTENPNASFPRLSYGSNTNNMKVSDFWKQNARYLRLQEVSLGYEMKLKALQNIGINSIEFQFTGNNLITWDNVKIFHPEQAWKNGVVYPIPTQYTFQMYINL